MTESTYWTAARRKISRRQALKSAATAAGVTAAWLASGCGGGGGNAGSTPADSGVTGSSSSATPTPRPSPAAPTFAVPPADSPGGTLQFAGFDTVVLDRYDPHQTQFGPMYNIQSAVFSKILKYDNVEEQVRSADLADAMPEVIDQSQYVIKLRPGAAFHDNERIRGIYPNLAGRQLTAEDVRYSFERQKNRASPNAPYFYHADHFQLMDAIEVVDQATLRIRTNGPVSPLLHFLADTNAFVIPSEIIDQAQDILDTPLGPRPWEKLIGSGPFMISSMNFGGEATFVSNPAWHGWGGQLRRPYLDGFRVRAITFDRALPTPNPPATPYVSLEDQFRSKRIDGISPNDYSLLEELKADYPELEYREQPASARLALLIKSDLAPFKDVRVRKAIHLATDRHDMLSVIFEDRGSIQGPVGSTSRLWAIEPDELARRPGYRTGTEREDDVTAARQLFEAAGSPDLGELTTVDVPDYLRRYAPVYAEQLRRALGVDVRFKSEPYSRIFEGLRTQGQHPFVFLMEEGGIDLDDWVYPYFHTAGGRNTFGISDAELDRMLEAQRAEFDEDARRRLGIQIQDYLLENTLTRIDCVSRTESSLLWPYVRNLRTFPWYGHRHWFADVWLDKANPEYAGRPS